MSHPVTWFQIYGREGGPLQQFYTNVFGWQMKPMPDGNGMVDPVKPNGIGGGVGASQDGRSSVTVFIECDDLDDQLATVMGHGGQMGMPPMELGDMGRIAGFIDPAGNWVGLWAPPMGMTRTAFYKMTNPQPEKKAAAPKKKKAAPKKKAKAKAKAAKAPAKKSGGKKAKKKGRR